MIKSFVDKLTQELFEREKVKKLPNEILRTAYKKLLILDAAESIEDLRIPHGNRLEKLTGDLSGKYSIRINNRWRIVFKWSGNNSYEVEIVDYHGG